MYVTETWMSTFLMVIKDIRVCVFFLKFIYYEDKIYRFFNNNNILNNIEQITNEQPRIEQAAEERIISLVYISVEIPSVI